MQRYHDKRASLLQIAAESLAYSTDESISDSLSVLPNNLKSKILRLKAKRGTLNDKSLGRLIDKETKVLDLSECDISDVGLRGLQQCIQLQKIDLNSMQIRSNVTDNGIIVLAHSCPLLRILYLRRCVKITDSSIVQVAQKCPNLVEVNLCGCTMITDMTLKALGEHCHKLRSLNVAHCPITDVGVFSLVSHHGTNSLTELDFSHSRLGDEGVEAVMLYCPKIKILVIHGLNISQSARESMDELALRNKMKQLSWTVY